ncbi:MAG: hypothetical protein K0Q94_3580 [Paenibacillus sp.]|jgi:hypothetical protein|nr:hypothetical protein [Paenibacillus sp.]
MEKMSRLDIALLRMGYVAAFFILIITIGGIVVALINMYRNGKLPLALPQEAEPDRLPDVAALSQQFIETAPPHKERSERRVGSERRVHSIAQRSEKNHDAKRGR